MERAIRHPWVGLELGVDPVSRARALIQARYRALAGEEVEGLRTVVTASWDRARTAGVDPEHHASPLLRDLRETRDCWSAHPLHRFAPLVQRLGCDFAWDSQHIVVIADADGCIIWTSGHPAVLSASETISFCPGHVWREEVVGTNGVGTALALDHPVQIFSAEHYNLTMRAWTCSGAPVHDPETGEMLGVIDISSGIRTAHPTSLALVSAAADAVESVLRGELEQRNALLRGEFYERAARWGSTRTALIDRTGRVLACQPHGWLTGPLVAAGEGAWLSAGSDGVLLAEPLGEGGQIVIEGNGFGVARPQLYLEALGDERARVTVDGLTVRLSPRHSEMLVLMALHPDGLSARELAVELFGDPSKLMSVRAEVSRLRRQLVGLIATRPYRVLADLDADFFDPDAARGQVLLPGAMSSGVVRERSRLHDYALA